MASTLLADNGVSSGSAGLKSSADSTGVLALQTTTSGGTATTAVTIDTSQNVSVGGNLLITSPAGLGYGTGSGGTVTQATSKNTAVTLNKPAGQITTSNSALAGGATAVFTLFSSIISSTDTVVVTTITSDNYRVGVQRSQAGYCNIFVTNNTGGSLSEAIVINFTVIKGAIS